MVPLVRVDFPASTDDPALAAVALVTIDRPEVLNALSSAVLDELAAAFARLDSDEACRCIVLTGAGSKAFAAGADIREMAGESAIDLVRGDRFARWDQIAAVRTPTVAAVRGHALGGGCELAMSCDVIVAGEDARFGQPELHLGIIPGAGGTQRLTRALGKAKAMELILTGRTMDAREADAHGLVSLVVPAKETLARALELAARIAAQPPLAVGAAREAIQAAFELPLSAGLALERRDFYLLFASEDRAEGMAAFLAKRQPTWKGR